MSPYDVLNVSADASDEDIRKAYLEKIKEFPPEHAPDEFKKISEAYSQIRDRKSRLNYYLFNREAPIKRPCEALIVQFRKTKERTPPDFEALKSFLRSSSKL